MTAKGIVVIYFGDTRENFGSIPDDLWYQQRRDDMRPAKTSRARSRA